MNVIDLRDGAPLSPHDLACRLAATRRIPPATDCVVPGGFTVTVIGKPDHLNRYPVRLALADGRTRDFALPAISLKPVEDRP